MTTPFFSRTTAVLFDLDGTLCDTAPDLAAPANAMRVARGLAPLPLAELRPHASAGARGLIGRALGIDRDHPEFEALKAEFLAAYERDMVVHTCLFPGMDELLERLERRGIGWGIVSNKVERYVRQITDRLALSARCIAIVGGDTAARAKPFPDPLLHAMKVAGLGASTASTIVYVGDDHRDIVAGKAAGMATIAAAFGYCGLEVPPHTWGADALVEHPREIAPLLGV
ncbi:MAG: HAD-IA family hydrolase [Lautropia sp.]